MESITKYWNPDLSYWELHPSMKYISLFATLYNDDKSKSKEASSKTMWIIAFLKDPHEENPWRNLMEDEKKKLLSIDFIKDKKFNWDDKNLLLLIDEYVNLCLTILEKELIMYEKKIVQRSKFIDETDYCLDYYEETAKGVKTIKGTATQLDTMLANTSKLFEAVYGLKNKLKEEAAEQKVKGGGSESASERGLI